MFNRCSLCDESLRSHKASLQKHEVTKKHSARDPRKSKQLVVLKNFIANPSKISEKKAEIKMAACMASHASISCVDHTGEIIKEFGVGSSWEKSRLHRTKCTSIILHVISPTLKEELRKEVQGRKFSLMADESTDCSSSKLMIVTIKYFNSNINQVVDEYLGTIDVLSCTGELLFEALVKVVEDVGLDLQDLIGFGSDGANNVAGSLI